MRITKVSVKKLFGIFDHEIPLNQDSRITIIHGPNGVGKTILLQLIRSVFRCDYELIGEIPFEQFRIEFENGDLITVKNFKEAKILSIHYDDGAGAENPVFRPRTSISAKIANDIEKLIPELTCSIVDGKPRWVSDADDSIFLAEDILDKYPKAHNLVYGEVPNWFMRIRKAVKIRLIQTQRLKRALSDNAELMRKIINGWGIRPDELDDLSSRNNVIEDLSTNLSEGFFRFYEWDAIPIDVLLDKFKRNAKEYSNVQELLFEDERKLFEGRHGRFDSVGTPFSDIFIISLWVGKQSKDVIDIFDETVEDATKEAVALLYDIINERFLLKSLTPDELFNVIAPDGSRVPLSSLSSGEQHLLILYSQLLFGEHPDSTLVLIDEPELSMNVVWQRNFLKDLQRIIELRKFDVLVATHSPQIIHDKWDWMVALGESEGES